MKTRSFTANLESDLALEFLRVVEEAAIASAKTMGQGDRKLADQVATEAMRGDDGLRCPCDGTIVIGEGERDEAPNALHRREGRASSRRRRTYPEVDIAVDPLEGTNLCATGIARRHHRAGGRPSAAACCTLPTATWRRSSSARPARAWSTWTRRSSHNLNVIAKRTGSRRRRSGHHRSRPPAPREADRRHPQDRAPASG